MTIHAADLDRLADWARALEDLIRVHPSDGFDAEEARRCCYEMRGKDGAIDNILDEIEGLLPALSPFALTADGMGAGDRAADLRERVADDLLGAIGAQIDWLRRRWR